MHRRLGVAYVASVGVGSIAAFYLAARTDLGWMFGAGITGLGVAWVVTTTMAIAAVRRGLIEQHQDWMIRSYVVTFAFVTFRVLWTLLQFAGIGTLREQLGVCSWFCWAVPLLVAEAALQGRKMTGARCSRAAVLVLVLLAMPASALAQARLTGADLDGLVRDESGGVLAGAVVTIVNAETGVARTIATDLDGRFRALSVVRQERVQSLPINGRNFLSFSVMTPGVTTDRSPQQGATATSGLSFTGQRARSNNIMVDGFDNNDPAVGAVRATFSQEAVRGFQVLRTPTPRSSAGPRAAW